MYLRSTLDTVEALWNPALVLDVWIGLLVKVNIQILIIDITGFPLYQAANLFNCTNLRNLELHYWSLQPPLEFGIQRLQALGYAPFAQYRFLKSGSV
ncbi:hypothetical protein TSUD_25940 [Trifolium subterraneum]|uniref:Uncharacterized protein n=1 Tax=Trifolium subterraneum TaxID=3900 RepID=A0A2Z6PMR4_TRISU|nr:hypothetical protein TSUD_25940 [Trifolium subterraneum]